MQVKATSEQDLASGVTPVSPWRVCAVRVLPGCKIDVRFFDGTQGTVDMNPLVYGEDAGLFAALRDPDVFSQAHLELGVVTWPGEIDLAPDAMYEQIKKHGTWILE